MDLMKKETEVICTGCGITIVLVLEGKIGFRVMKNFTIQIVEVGNIVPKPPSVVNML